MKSQLSLLLSPKYWTLFIGLLGAWTLVCEGFIVYLWSARNGGPTPMPPSDLGIVWLSSRMISTSEAREHAQALALQKESEANGTKISPIARHCLLASHSSLLASSGTNLVPLESEAMPAISDREAGLVVGADGILIDLSDLYLAKADTKRLLSETVQASSGLQHIPGPPVKLLQKPFELGDLLRLVHTVVRPSSA